jgi:hypothetical protein
MMKRRGLMMRISNFHFQAKLPDDGPLFRRYFFKLFKDKKYSGGRLRHPDAIPPDELKRQVIALGKGKKVNITRLSYDGTPEDQPVAVKIIDIGHDHFTGKVINVEREVSESQETKLIYLKGGGGTIDFNFDDGDIISVVADIDEEIIQERPVEEIKEILEALDLNEDITISYFDRDKGGVINGVGVLSEKDTETLDFTVTLHMINDIKLKEPKKVALNLDKDQILDLEVQI